MKKIGSGLLLILLLTSILTLIYRIQPVSADGTAMLHVTLTSEFGLPFDADVQIFDGPHDFEGAFVTRFSTQNGEGQTQLNSDKTYAVMVWDKEYFFIENIFLPPEGANLTFAATNQTVGKVVVYCYDVAGNLTFGDLGIGVEPWTLESGGSHFIVSNFQVTPVTFRISPMTFNPIVEIRSWMPDWIWSFNGKPDINITAGQVVSFSAGGPTTTLLETQRGGYGISRFYLDNHVGILFRVSDGYGDWMDYVESTSAVSYPNIVILDPHLGLALNESSSPYALSSGYPYFQPEAIGEYSCTVTWDTGPYQGVIKKTVLFDVTIPGDINGDFKVSLQDLTILAIAYGSHQTDARWNPNADIDGNNAVGLTDLTMLAIHYGQHSP